MANQADQLLQPDEPEVTKVTTAKAHSAVELVAEPLSVSVRSLSVLLLYRDNLPTFLSGT